MLQTIADLNLQQQEAAMEWERAKAEAEADKKRSIEILSNQYEGHTLKLQVRVVSTCTHGLHHACIFRALIAVQQRIADLEDKSHRMQEEMAAMAKDLNVARRREHAAEERSALAAKMTDAAEARAMELKKELAEAQRAAALAEDVLGRSGAKGGTNSSTISAAAPSGTIANELYEAQVKRASSYHCH